MLILRLLRNLSNWFHAEKALIFFLSLREGYFLFFFVVSGSTWTASEKPLQRSAATMDTWNDQHLLTGKRRTNHIRHIKRITLSMRNFTTYPQNYKDISACWWENAMNRNYFIIVGKSASDLRWTKGNCTNIWPSMVITGAELSTTLRQTRDQSGYRLILRNVKARPKNQPKNCWNGSYNSTERFGFNFFQPWLTSLNF